MFHNLSMLNGFAFCGEDEAYEHTYLDRIKLDKNYLHDNLNDKPVHIDKLFENEDAFLGDELNDNQKICGKSSTIKMDGSIYSGNLDPAKLMSKSTKNPSQKDRRKLKR